MKVETQTASRERGWARWIAPVLLLVLPILLLSAAIRIEMNSLGLYTRGFHIYEVGQTTGLSEDQLDAAAAKLIAYFNSFAETPQMTVSHADGIPFDLFHDYELIHLSDVKSLFEANTVAQALSMFVVALFVLAGLSLGRRSDVYSGLRYGALFTIALLALSSMAFVTDFSRMFVAFHLVAFDNSFWQLNPYTDYLVMLFPLGFWQDMFIFAGAGTGIAAIAVYTAATSLTRRARSRGHRLREPIHGKQ